MSIINKISFFFCLMFILIFMPSLNVSASSESRPQGTFQYIDVAGLPLDIPLSGGNISTTRTVVPVSEEIRFDLGSISLYSSGSNVLNLNGHNYSISFFQNGSSYTGTLTETGTSNTISLSFSGSIKDSHVYLNHYEFNPGYLFSGFNVPMGSDLFVLGQVLIAPENGVRLAYDPFNSSASCTTSGQTSLLLSNDVVPVGSAVFFNMGKVSLYSISTSPASSMTYTVTTNANWLHFYRDYTTTIIEHIDNGLGHNFVPSGSISSENQAISSGIDSISSFEQSNFNNLSSSFDSVNIESMDMSELVSGFALVSSVVNAIFSGSVEEYRVFLYGLLAIGVIVVLLSVVGRVGRGIGGD